MPPNSQIERILDIQHGERGRLVYGCASKWWLAGLCLKNN
jgi:arylsulfatase B